MLKNSKMLKAARTLFGVGAAISLVACSYGITIGSSEDCEDFEDPVPSRIARVVEESPCLSEEDNYIAISDASGITYYFVCDVDGWRRTQEAEYYCFSKHAKNGDECIAIEKKKKYVYTYTDSSKWATLSSLSDDDPVSKDPHPKKTCSKDNDGAHIKVSNWIYTIPNKYFVCNDGEWKETGRTDYECPSERAKVGDVCDYFNSDSTVFAYPGHDVHAVFTEDGVWDKPELLSCKFDEKLESAVCEN